MNQTPVLGSFGVWRSAAVLTPELATHLERLGFGAIWIGGSPGGDLALAESLLAATEKITIATGIVNIWTSDALDVAVSYHRLDERYPGRFLLGIGTGHPERVGAKAARPYGAMVEYLDTLDLERVPVERRVLAALGPRMLELARDRSAGAHPYLVTPAHTAVARETLGQGPLLAPEQRVVLRETREDARGLGRPGVQNPYLGLVNYRANLRRLGYSDAELEGGGSDRLVDDLVVSGDDGQILDRLRAHLDAGADHVAIQLITAPDDDVFEAFAHLGRIVAAA